MKYNKTILKSVQGTNPLIPKQIYKDKLLGLANTLSINQRFMGAGMSQNYFSLPWFEAYFDSHNFEYIIEFGSQKGCLSTYFANFAGITEKVFFETYELYPDKDWYSRENEGAGHWYEQLASISPYINYFHKDVFGEEVSTHIKENISEFKTFIFCDGGDKPKEFNMYAPMLKVGDCIAVHDWGSEILFSHIEDSVEKYGLEVDSLFAKSAQEHGTLIMPFIKTK